MLDPLAIELETSAVPSLSHTPSNLPVRKLLQPSPTHPDDYILEIDYSALSTFLACPRSFENQYVHSREAARPAHALQFGRLFHECEELRLRLPSDFPRSGLDSRQRDLVIQHFSIHPIPPDEYRSADRMLDVLRLYNDRYCDDGWPSRVVQHEGVPFIERPFKIELCTVPVNGQLNYTDSQLVADYSNSPTEEQWLRVRNIHIIATGRIDTAIHEGDSIFVVDNKTSSRGGREFEEAFNLSLQTRGYTWALKKILGHSLDDPTIQGLIMNAVVVRPLTRTGTGTEFNRHTYFYSGDSLREWEADVRAHLEDLVNCLVRGYFPQSARSFKSPCSGCDFHDNCQLPPAQRPADLATSLFRDVVWNPITNVD